MKTRIKQIHKQLDRLERDFMFNSNRMQELSNENRRGNSEYWRLHEEARVSTTRSASCSRSFGNFKI